MKLKPIKQENSSPGNLWIPEIELSALILSIFAASKAEKFGAALGLTIKQLKQQLKKRKAVFQAH